MFRNYNVKSWRRLRLLTINNTGFSDILKNDGILQSHDRLFKKLPIRQDTMKELNKYNSNYT